MDAKVIVLLQHLNKNNGMKFIVKFKKLEFADLLTLSIAKRKTDT